MNFLIFVTFSKSKIISKLKVKKIVSMLYEKGSIIIFIFQEKILKNRKINKLPKIPQLENGRTRFQVQDLRCYDFVWPEALLIQKCLYLLLILL